MSDIDRSTLDEFLHIQEQYTNMWEIILKTYDWRFLAENNLYALAVLAYRKENPNESISSCDDFVRTYLGNTK